MEIVTNACTAKEPPWALAIRQDAGFLSQITEIINGPFHLIHPASFCQNYRRFNEVLQSHSVSGAVYYAKKANKAAIWLRMVAQEDGFVDVASIPEFIHALANGVKGSHIGVSGAAKSNDLLWLAGQHGAIVAIDALDELERAITLATSQQCLRILLRILPPDCDNSRFGLNPSDMQIALQKCVTYQKHITMEGFSFHLDGYTVEPRASLAAQLVDQCLEARTLGLAAHSISIGGGFACSYLDKSDWDNFRRNLSSEQFHAQKSFEKFYPYHQAPAGAAMLDAILKSPKDNGTLADALKAAQINLLMEPGRALLDGAGLSVFPVQGFKQNDKHGLITVAGLSMSLSEQWKGSEFLPSPHLVQLGAPRPQEAIQAAIGGSSCMEYDMLSWRKISFPAKPRYGDLIIYPNTAGYQMDKNESSFHQLALPPKIIVQNDKSGFSWRVDA